jgi:DNA repair protein RecO (recombination protein O)
MLHKTRGIALHTISFSETSLIVKIYTEAFGLSSYIVKGSRSHRSKMRPVFFQPLTLLELDVYHRGKPSLQTIKEIRIPEPYHSIPYDIRKSSIALFLNELIYKSLVEEEPNSSLFSFFWNAFLTLDRSMESVSSFHLVFALKFTTYLGFVPRMNYQPDRSFFNLREGIFQKQIPPDAEFLDSRLSEVFFRILQTSLEEIPAHPLPASVRNELLETILLYYRIHIPGIREIVSHKVLHTILA